MQVEVANLPSALRRPYAKVRQQAKQAGLTGDDLEDCMMEFLERILTGDITLPDSLPPAKFNAWLKRTAPRHVLNSLRTQSVKELADAYRRKPHAVEQILQRARDRLKELLALRGYTEAALREYFFPPASPPGKRGGGRSSDDEPY